MIQKLLKLLGSLRLTIYLILALGCVFLLGLWIPQANVLKMALYLQWKSEHPQLLTFLEFFRLTQIYTSPLTISLWACFFINLSLVMWKRLPSVLNRCRINDANLRDPRQSGFESQQAITIPQSLSEQWLRTTLAGAGYKFYRTKAGFIAVKNALSPIATLLFHLSFFLMLLGGIVNLYSRFAGYVDISEGESFSGELARYNAPPRMPKLGTPPTSEITIEKVAPESVDGMPTRLVVTLLDQQGHRHQAEINHPYRVGATTFVVTTIGVTPLFVMTDPEGKEIDGAFVKLNVLGDKTDNFPMLDYRIQARFFPDYFSSGDTEGSNSNDFKRPAFHLQVTKDGKPLAKKTLLAGESLQVAGNFLAFKEMRLWVRLYVVKEHGLGIVFAGFLLAIGALVWRFMFYRRELLGMIIPGEHSATLFLAGRSEFYRNLYQEEFEKLVTLLEQSKG